jgi:hypothetical protein
MNTLDSNNLSSFGRYEKNLETTQSMKIVWYFYDWMAFCIRFHSQFKLENRT